MPKNKKVKHAGFMSPENAQLVDRGEEPKMWCQRTTIKTYVHREWGVDSPLKHLIDCLEERMKNVYRFRTIKPDDYKKFRIVFWFDN